MKKYLKAIESICTRFDKKTIRAALDGVLEVAICDFSSGGISQEDYDIVVNEYTKAIHPEFFKEKSAPAATDTD